MSKQGQENIFQSLSLREWDEMLRIFRGDLETTESGNEGREGASTVPQLALHFDISLAGGGESRHKQLACQMVTSATPTASGIWPYSSAKI